MGLFDFLKKKKQPKQSVSMEEYIKIKKDEGVSDDDIKEEIMDDFKSKMFGDKSSVSLDDDDDDEEKPYMDKLPTPKGNFTEKGVEEIWDNSSLIEYDKNEGDLENVKYWREEEKKDKESYYYGKKIYEERFGEIVNSPLTDVIKNLSELIIDEYYEDDDYNFRVWEKLQRVGENHKFWELSFFGGEEVGEGYEK